MDRRRILLIAAAFIAALGTILVFLYVRSADARAEARFDTVNVLRAVAPIEAGETIEDAANSGKLALQPVPRDQLLPNYRTSIDDLRGLVATSPIYVGEQVIADKFAGESFAESPLGIPKGELAISVNLTDPARVAGFVNPGSEVAIFLNGSDPETGETYTRMLLERVTVLGVGSTTPVSKTTTDSEGGEVTEQLPRTLLTLALSGKDAQRVLYATANGELAFGLLTQSSTVDPGPPVDATNLFR